MAGTGTEVGVGYISIAASTQDFAKDVKSALGDFDKEASKITDGKNGFGAKLAGGLKTAGKVGVTAVAGIGAAVTGVALKKGLDRALALDETNAKLAGLGHSAESVEKIMGNALDSVRGTAFGLGDAATVAASAVAAGIKPGTDLTRTLKLVGDAATIAGTDMGSMGAIFNKVAASNKVQMDVINQLHDAGVPALALLADQMGVTAEEASKMASKGEIDFATFQEAMEKGMGGAALKSGETAKGAWANMLAALGRVGEKLVSKVLPYVVQFFGAVMQWADRISPHVEQVATWLGDRIPVAVQWMKDNVLPALKSVGDFIVSTLIPAFIAIGTWVKDSVFPILVAFGTWLGETLLKHFQAISDWINTNVVPGLKALFSEMRTGEGTGGALASVLKTVASALISLGKWIAENTKLVMLAVGAWGAYKAVVLTHSFAKFLIGVVQSTKAIIVQTVAVVKNTAAWIASKSVTVAIAALYVKDFLVALTRSTAAIVKNTAVWIAHTSAQVASRVAIIATSVAMKAATAAQWLFNTALAANPIGLLVTAIGALVGALAWFFTQTEVGRKAWEVFTNALAKGWEWVSNLFMSYLGLVVSVWRGAWDTAVALFNGAWEGIKAVAGWIVDIFLNWTLPGLIIQHWDTIKAKTESVWNGIKSFFSAIPGAIAGFFANLGNILATPFVSAWDVIKSTWETLKTWFSGLGATFVNSMASVKDALLSPFKAAFNAIAKAWNNTVGKLSFTVPSWVPKYGGKGWKAPQIPMLATGGTAMAPGWSLVGEAGPELLHMPRGASVVPLDHPASSMSGAGGDSPGLERVLRLLDDVLARPVVVKVGERTLFEAITDLERRFGGR